MRYDSPSNKLILETFVSERRARGFTFGEIERQLLRDGLFYYASEAHAYVMEVQRREGAEHARTMKAARFFAFKQIAAIGIGLAIVVAFVAFAEVRRSEVAASLVVGCLGLIGGCALNLVRLYLSRSDDHALTEIASPKRKDELSKWPEPTEGLTEMQAQLLERRSREAMEAQRSGIRPM